jgi:hypothetical protein
LVFDTHRERKTDGSKQIVCLSYVYPKQGYVLHRSYPLHDVTRREYLLPITSSTTTTTTTTTYRYVPWVPPPPPAHSSCPCSPAQLLNHLLSRSSALPPRTSPTLRWFGRMMFSTRWRRRRCRRRAENNNYSTRSRTSSSSSSFSDKIN